MFCGTELPFHLFGSKGSRKELIFRLVFSLSEYFFTVIMKSSSCLITAKKKVIIFLNGDT
jgi:hypothetical protein|tara:strand:+ start:627 stop:806 length:180 start_codon:yes stop_codon:yes gene_type:complete